MDSYQKYLNKALRFLSYRARSEKEVFDYLQKKQSPPEIVSQVMAFLRERRFVNDEEFAANWIEQRIRVKSKAIRVVRLELKQKGVSEDIISQASSNFQLPISPTSLKLPPLPEASVGHGRGTSNIQELEGISDLETAKKLVQKKIDKYKNLTRQDIYQKLGGFLARRGFDWETIKKTIDAELRKEH